MSTFSFFLREKVGREKLKWERSLFQGKVNPNSNGVFDPRIKRALLLCTCLRLFAGKWTWKGGQGKTQIGEESLSGNANPNSNGVFDPRIKRALLLCMCPRIFAGKWIGKGGQGSTQNRGGVSLRFCKLIPIWPFLHSL